MGLSTWITNNQLFIEATIVLAIVACSVQVALSAGVFSLASIGFYQGGTYAAADLVRHGIPSFGAIALAVAGAGVGGWALARILVRLSGLYLAMATIAFDLMVGVLALNWTSVTGGALGLYGIPVDVSLPAMAVVLVVVVAALSRLERGTLGRMFSTCRDDAQIVVTVGFDVQRLRRFAFVLSAGLGALAGGIHALSFNSISPSDVSFQFIILALAMVVIGGVGSWRGALLGAILIAWLPLKLSFLGEWWPVVYGATMVVVATCVPEGLYGLIDRGIRRIPWPSRRRRRAAGQLVYP
ncbi:MAG: branched-chain amino acid ABC transporter permease [Actinomycetota bacterium]|jgi:branched-chain amino acid transport system permease protein|nr:branched-chain amino acid ABC transporter permease [Actinomycetota bacterium]